MTNNATREARKVSINKTIAEIARVLKPGGLLFYDTINRSFLSWLMMIKVAQDWKSTAWEAPNTHEWRRFVKIKELGSIMKLNGLIMKENKGFNPRNSMKDLLKAVRERAKGNISRHEMAMRFGFEKNDKVAVSYMGFAIKQ